MFFPVSKKLKISLALFTFVGLVLSLSCAVNYHPETAAHAPVSESTAIAQGSAECCGTTISKSTHSLQEALLATPRGYARSLYGLFAVGLVFVSIIFGRRPGGDLAQRLLTQVRMYIKKSPEIVALYHLRFAFSQGILNPKKYNLTTI